MGTIGGANIGRFPLVLYKRILRLHYGLPSPEMKLMGDAYVKDEFRRHKNSAPEFALLFLKEWAEYCTMLSKQLSNKGLVKGLSVGKDLDPEQIEMLEEQKLMQLYELKQEAEKWKQRKS